MIVVDSSVWIDYLNDTVTKQTALLDRLIELSQLATGDLMLVEVLQGARSDVAFDQICALLERVPIIAIADRSLAIAAARNYRLLRRRGITIRTTIDMLIATRCIIDGHSLLYSDRDFDPFVEHLGLRSALDQA